MVLVSLYDCKADSFSKPMVADSKAAALRDFGFVVNDGKSLVSLAPQDFSLFQVGEWDGKTLIACDKVCLGNGVDVLRPAINSEESN